MPRRSRRRKPLPQETHSALVESLSHDGRGITHINGKTTFLAGGLPQEQVEFHYTRQHGSFDEGQVSQVITPSPMRRTPPCPHFGVCGGCSLQHIDLDQQLAHKQQAFQQLLQHQAKLQPRTWLPPIISPAWGYRRKARLGVKYVPKKQRVLIGFRERQGRLIADTTQCDVLHPSIGQRITAFAALINNLSVRDKIPQLEVSIGDNANAVIIRHLAAFNEQDLTAIAEFGAEHQLRIYLQPEKNDSVHLFYPTAAAPLHYKLPRYDLTLEFQPLQFVQINADVNQAMIDRALELLDLQPQDRVLDLFCGIGNFSLPMARRGALVTGVEGDISAVRQAQQNAQLNQLNAEFYCADLFTPPFAAEWSQKSYDKLLLDPPRSGAAAIVESIHTWRPRRIVYVSCDLATLARDSYTLSQQGYQLIQAGMMDMFPHTQHIEAIALFETKAS